MLITTLIALVMMLAAFAAPVAVVVGIWLLLTSALTKKKQWTKGAAFLLAGILCVAINPVAWQMIDGMAQSVSAGDSGARWISYNAPGSGFVWNGIRYLDLNISHPWIDSEGKQGIHVMQPKKKGEFIDLNDFLFPDWVYPVENDGGFDLYHYNNFLYCPEGRMDAALEYFQDTAHVDALR